MLAKFLFTSVPGAIILGALIVSTTILVAIGSLKNNNSAAQKKETNIAQAAQPTQAPSQVLAATASPSEAPKPVKLSIAEDPILGDKNTKLAVVEFADYGCPQCKKSFTEVLPELRKKYIDTGKVKLVYKDLPIPSTAYLVEAALCAKDQGGDTAYFKYHDQLVANMKADGTSISTEELPGFAKEINLNVKNFQKCLDSGKFQTVFEKNFTVAQNVGISRIPTWFLGKINSSGEVEGSILAFAQSFNDLKAAIDQQLSQ